MTTQQEKNLTKELRELLDDNSNYTSSYTGTPVFFSDRAIPKIIALLKAKNISSNVPVMRSLPKRKPFKKWTADEYDMAANAVAEAMKLTSTEWGIIRYAVRKAVEQNS